MLFGKEKRLVVLRTTQDDASLGFSHNLCFLFLRFATALVEVC